MGVSWERGAGLVGGAALLYGMVEAWQVQVREYEIALANLPRFAEGTRVLQLSDLHVGLFMPRTLLRRIVTLAVGQQPDLVVLTGDMVSRRNSYLPPLNALARTVTEYAANLAEALRPLNPPLGLWTVPGNHDVWEGTFSPISDALGKVGVVPLVNRSARLKNGLTLVGVDDLRAGNAYMRGAFEGVPPNIGHVVLSHNPRFTLLLREREALVLSGHTHGGQIKIPHILDKAPADAEGTFLLRGFYPVGRAQLYVSSGLGTVGIPVRLNVPPEIAVFTLRCKS